jgi:hypothetical protein
VFHESVLPLHVSEVTKALPKCIAHGGWRAYLAAR